MNVIVLKHEKADFNLFPVSLDGRNADHLEESLAFSVTDHYADDIQNVSFFSLKSIKIFQAKDQCLKLASGLES